METKEQGVNITVRSTASVEQDIADLKKKMRTTSISEIIRRALAFTNRQFSEEP